MIQYNETNKNKSICYYYYYMQYSKQNQYVVQTKTKDLQEQASYKQCEVRSRYIPCSNQEQHTNHRCCCSTPYLLLSCFFELCLESKFLKKPTQGMMIKVRQESQTNIEETQEKREEVVKIGLLLLCFSSPFIYVYAIRENGTLQNHFSATCLQIFFSTLLLFFFNNKLNNYLLLTLLIGSNKYYLKFVQEENISYYTIIFFLLSSTQRKTFFS